MLLICLEIPVIILSCLTYDYCNMDTNKNDCLVMQSENFKVLEDCFSRKVGHYPESVTILTKDNKVYNSEDVNNVFSLMSNKIEDCYCDVKSLLAVYPTEEEGNKNFRMINFYSNGRPKEAYEGKGSIVSGNYTAWNQDGESLVFTKIIDGFAFNIEDQDENFSIKDDWSREGKSHSIVEKFGIKIERSDSFRNGGKHGKCYGFNRSALSFMDMNIPVDSYFEENYESGFLQEGEYFLGTEIASSVIEGSGVKTDVTIMEETGKIAVITSEIVAGRKHGVERKVMFSKIEAPILLEEVCYYEGDKQGICSEFYKNGNKKTVSNWKKNLLCGEVRLYREDGSLYVESTADNNQRCVAISLFNTENKKVAEESYGEDGKIEKGIYFNQEGDKVESIENGKGIRLFFNENGEVVNKALIVGGIAVENT